MADHASEQPEQPGSPPTPPRGPYRAPRWLKITLISAVILVVLGGLAGIGSIVGVFWFYGRSVEDIDEQALRDYRPPQVTRVLDRKGVLIGEIFTQRRTFIAYEDIPAHVENAFLAAEDADFYRHEGMDYIGMVRALVANVRAGAMRQGASTITQQVVKNFLLSPERTFERKVQELILARRIEELLDKSEILELYLNEIYLGHGRYGIEEASRFYFGKGTADIDLGQAALLATLPKAPSTSTPYKNYDKAKARQRYVLEQMQKHGFATPDEVAKYLDAPLEIVSRDANSDVDTEIDPERAAKVQPGAEEFVDIAKAELVERYGADALGELGATVTMTVDLEVQRAARQSVLDGLVAMDTRRQWGHGISPAKDNNRARAIKRGAGAHAAGKIYPVIIDARGPEIPEGLRERGFPATIGDELKVWVRVEPGSRYDDPKLTHAQQFPAGGITMGRLLALEAPAELGLPKGWALAEIGSGPEAATVIAEVDSGEVLAMVGGYRYSRGDFNRVLKAKRQPGSSFKPFVYGAAIQSRRFTAASLIEDSPEIYEKWRPTNYERDVYRGEIRMRVALTHSVNTVAIKLLDAVGIDAAIDLAAACGIETELGRDLSLALGTSEVSPFELMRAYLTLARGGSRIEPSFIRSIAVPGEDTWTPEREVEQVVDAGVVFIVASLMRSVVEEGTGTGAKKLGVPVAGKTGTAAESRDAWFAGFTEDFVTVSWVGFDTPKPMRRESGGKAALPIWLGVMKAALARPKPEEVATFAPQFSPFTPPPSVSVRTIDRTTGLLAPATVTNAEGLEVPPDPATVLEEYFLVGTEPTEVASAAAAAGEAETDILLDLYGDEPGEAPEEEGEGDEFGDESEVDGAAAPPAVPQEEPIEQGEEPVQPAQPESDPEPGLDLEGLPSL
ncbi:PBP1A family penicillin-binding protein [Pseudenhygromyxa sp. WMMC2535]|uniref:PBP1A family penicillin-binding protein n=1 Tax=Pseudenhygromyxa sp. WMMC2535 TaxID=2712867 RepID=UPI0015553736|nr:PBP1A family penicillin-binding protein [Pseudenhygromyxa sp. WMMC2535]